MKTHQKTRHSAGRFAVQPLWVYSAPSGSGTGWAAAGSSSKAKSITVSGLELSSNVGAFAQDGWIVVDLKFEAQEDKAVFSMLFVDSYTYIQIGPIKKKSSQGITDFGMKTLDYQSQYIADQFQSLLGTYSYYLDNGLI